MVFKRKKNGGDGDVISVLYLSWDLRRGLQFPLVETLGPRSEPVALPGSLFKQISQSPHLCCIMGQSERPCTVDTPKRRQTDSFLTPK